jgi:hypothetical protein
MWRGGEAQAQRNYKVWFGRWLSLTWGVKSEEAEGVQGLTVRDFECQPEWMGNGEPRVVLEWGKNPLLVDWF